LSKNTFPLILLNALVRCVYQQNRLCAFLIENISHDMYSASYLILDQHRLVTIPLTVCFISGNSYNSLSNQST